MPAALSADTTFLTLRPLQLRNCVEAQQFDRDMLEELFPIADEMAEIKPGTAGAKSLEGAAATYGAVPGARKHYDLRRT